MKTEQYFLKIKTDINEHKILYLMEESYQFPVQFYFIQKSTIIFKTDY